MTGAESGEANSDPIPAVRGGANSDPIPAVRGVANSDPIPAVRGGANSDPIPAVRSGANSDPLPQWEVGPILTPYQWEVEPILIPTCSGKCIQWMVGPILTPYLQGEVHSVNGGANSDPPPQWEVGPILTPYLQREVHADGERHRRSSCGADTRSRHKPDSQTIIFTSTWTLPSSYIKLKGSLSIVFTLAPMIKWQHLQLW